MNEREISFNILPISWFCSHINGIEILQKMKIVTLSSSSSFYSSSTKWKVYCGFVSLQLRAKPC